MVVIKIIRHSERLDFTHPLYWLICFGHHWSDSPLTNNGHEIAKLKGIELAKSGFDAKYIYTSPYSRTMATATEIQSSYPNSEIIIEHLLAEYQPYYKHRINLYPNGIPTEYSGTGTDFSYPEKYSSFKSRVKFIVSKLIEKHDDNIIIVTHGELLKVYINYIQTLYPDLLLDPVSVPYLTTLTFEFDKTSNIIIENSVTVE
ncbi:putative phosphoglycerate mutase family protein [Cotonvirus japonicus]|uniref:Phosphoglycerate mutase family protein n=1 Tax=Cotonvirus japonicus TaxID=2811091 RepID=A0ABM7NRV8_9VIRU|nr:putative phosphoglycerate mutase family protein [Cotonvirus japonicus]BCS82894.1 putative phosphoglycerate mutase family protein [Cotonvirus japonicus]